MVLLLSGISALDYHFNGTSKKKYYCQRIFRYFLGHECNEGLNLASKIQRPFGKLN